MLSTRRSTLRSWAIALLLLLAWTPVHAQGPAPGAPPDAEWRAFRNRYVTAGGRVIDTANNGISHSEGQGYGMFFAVHFDDRPSFDRLWGWTQHNLRRPQDGLFAWRYDPRSSFPVSDPNNATDGDIFIAWALLLASERWEVPEYRAAATGIAEDILRYCVTEVAGRMVLLPGIAGFRSAEGTVVNLSYYAFPAIRALSRLVSDRRWARLERDGLDLIREAGFGRWRLPPDWLLLPTSGAPVPAPSRPLRFSWDALRVPLNLAWLPAEHEALTAARGFWAYPGHPHRPPAWVDLRTGETAPYAGHAGVRAVQALAKRREGEAPDVSIRVAEAPDYFGAALILQARIASTSSPEPPAVEPAEEPARPPALRARIANLGSSILARMVAHDHRESHPAPLPQWARVEFLEPQVRGVRPGLRGLTAPR